MRITKVDIPKSEKDLDGLEEIKMSRLGQIVLLAGKNGSGKTRILDKILNRLALKPSKNDLENARKQIENSKDRITSLENAIESLESELKRAIDPTQIYSINRDIKNFSDSIANYEQQVEKHYTTLSWKQIETKGLKERYTAVHFVPKELNLYDSNNYNKTQILREANTVSNVGVDGLSRGTFAKIQVIQDRWFNATHHRSQVNEEEKNKAISEYEKLNDLVSIFLNTSIGRTINDEATLFGFPLGKSKLSDGQKILLQFCLAIYGQETKLKDLVLIMDEPENHLHPSAIIETLDRIAKYVSNGQIWIATHSVPLLAHYDPSLIWFVENNKVSYGGRITEKVLRSLLGDENEIARLQDFVSLPAQFATSRYAFECLFEPKTLQTDSNDPQSVQIREELLKLTTTGKIRVLDFGAGKGRIISNLIDLDSETQKHLVDQLDYIAFDPDSKDKEYCESAISKAYGNCNNRYFNSLDKLLEIYDKESFNVVILCNVLHEIDPKEWLKLFSPEGSISQLLGSKGFLLLVEDHQISIGEKAYQKGFLVLDTLQLKEIFKITEQDEGFTFVDARKDGRLKAHLIAKEYLMRIDENSRLDALKSICQTAKSKILEIREDEKNYRNGKKHGFWVQQLANAQLNLDEFTTKK